MDEYIVLHYPDMNAFNRYYDLIEYYDEETHANENTLRFLEMIACLFGMLYIALQHLGKNVKNNKGLLWLNFSSTSAKI